MKKILLFFVTVITLTSLSALNQPPNLDNINSEHIVYNSLPDSLHRFIKNRSLIFYSYGHYGYSWSLIVKMDSSYKIFSGRVDYSGYRHLNATKEINQIDTAMLFYKNNDLFSWGFDSISTEIKSMKKIKQEPYTTIYSDLSVYNQEGERIFGSDDAIAYSGPDSISFNKKFHKLCAIMRWISDSKFRQYVPDPIID